MSEYVFAMRDPISVLDAALEAEAREELATDDRPLCDHQVDVDDSTWFECELPMHHPGRHRYTFTWENEPYGPQLPTVRQTPIWVPEAWAESIMASWRASLLRHPVR